MPVIYAATIITLSSLQPPPPARGIPASDKLLHMAVFGLMAVFVAMALHRPRRPFTWKRALIAIVITSAYGAVDEAYQIGVPGRFGSSADALADAFGAILAVGWYCVIAKKWPDLSLIMGN